MDAITTDSAKSLEQKYAAKKRAKRLGTAPAKVAPAKTATPSAKKTVAAKSTASAKKKSSALDDEVADDYFSQFSRDAQQWSPWDSAGYDDGGAGGPDDGEIGDLKKIGEDANRINQYYERFPQTRGGNGKKGEKYYQWSGLDDPRDIELELARIRSVLNGAAAESALKGYLVMGAKGLEALTHTYNYNPLNLNIHYLGDAVATALFASRPGESPFDPEITELAIEYGPWLGSGPEMRFLMKLVQFVWMYSQLQKKPDMFKMPDGVHTNSEVPAAVVLNAPSEGPQEIKTKNKGKKTARFTL